MVDGKMPRKLTRPPLLALALLVAVVAGALAAAGTTATSPPKITLPTKPMSAAEAAKVTSGVELAISFQSEDVPGMLVGIWDPQKGVYRRAFGVGNTASAAPTTVADAFRVGSVTKTFTATLILQLVAEGKLRLDGRVSAYAPALAKRFPDVGSRTIRELLSMRSGLPDYADTLVPRIPITPGWTTKVWQPNQLINWGIRWSGPILPAGAAKATYSNTNYITLGQVAVAVTGKSLPRLVQERFLGPLEMRRSSYPRAADASLPARSTHGYVTASGVEDFTKYGSTIEEGTDVTQWSPSFGGAAGVVISTIDDLARWAAARFGSALLPDSLQRARVQDSRSLNDGGRYGLGLQILGDWEGHLGGIPGWSTLALRNTKTGAIAIMSINACCGGDPTFTMLGVLNTIYPGTFDL